MAWLFLVAAILGLVFPPIGVVVVAIMVLSVFTKGVLADSQDEIVSVRRGARHERGAGRRKTAPHPASEPHQGPIIDVRCYPVLPPLRIPAAVPKSRDRLH